MTGGEDEGDVDSVALEQVYQYLRWLCDEEPQGRDRFDDLEAACRALGVSASALDDEIEAAVGSIEYSKVQNKLLVLLGRKTLNAPFTDLRKECDRAAYDLTDGAYESCTDRRLAFAYLQHFEDCRGPRVPAFGVDKEERKRLVGRVRGEGRGYAIDLQRHLAKTLLKRRRSFSKGPTFADETAADPLLVTRQWLVDDVRQWLTRPGDAPLLALVGSMHWGKSTFLSQLARRFGEWDLPIAQALAVLRDRRLNQRVDDNNPDVVLPRWIREATEQEAVSSTRRDLAEELIGALSHEFSRTGQPTLLIVDGLDEKDGAQFATCLADELLPNPRFTTAARVLITTRPQHLGDLTGHPLVKVRDLDRVSREQLRRDLRSVAIAGMQAIVDSNDLDVEDLADAIADRALAEVGNESFASMAYAALASGHVADSPDPRAAILELPPEFESVLESELRRIESEPGSADGRLEVFRAAVAGLSPGLDKQQLAEIVRPQIPDANPERVRLWCEIAFRQLLARTDAGHYIPRWPFVSTLLLEPSDPSGATHRPPPSESHELIGRWAAECWDTDPYAARHVLEHLLRACGNGEVVLSGRLLNSDPRRLIEDLCGNLAFWNTLAQWHGPAEVERVARTLVEGVERGVLLRGANGTIAPWIEPLAVALGDAGHRITQLGGHPDRLLLQTTFEAALTGELEVVAKVSSWLAGENTRHLQFDVPEPRQHPLFRFVGFATGRSWLTAIDDVVATWSPEGTATIWEIFRTQRSLALEPARDATIRYLVPLRKIERGVSTPYIAGHLSDDTVQIWTRDGHTIRSPETTHVRRLFAGSEGTQLYLERGDKTLLRWDVADESLGPPLKARAIDTAEFIATGDLIMFRDHDQHLRALDFVDGDLHDLGELAAPVRRSIAVDGHLVTLLADGRLMAWSAARKRPLELRPRLAAEVKDWVDVGPRLVVLDADGDLSTWHVGRGERESSRPVRDLNCLGSAGQRLVCAYLDGRLVVSSPSLDDPIDLGAYAFRARQILAVDEDCFVTVHEDGALCRWPVPPRDTVAGTVHIRRPQAMPSRISATDLTSKPMHRALSIHSVGDRLVTRHDGSELISWDPTTSTPTTLPSISSRIVELIPTAHHVVTRHVDGILRARHADGSEGEHTLSLTSPPLETIAVGASIVMRDEDDRLVFWSASSGRPVGIASTAAGAAFKIVSAGDFAISVHQDALLVWDPFQASAPVHVLTAVGETLDHLTLVDGSIFAVRGQCELVRWELNDQVGSEPPVVVGLSASPFRRLLAVDGAVVSLHGSGLILRWDAEAGGCEEVGFYRMPVVRAAVCGSNLITQHLNARLFSWGTRAISTPSCLSDHLSPISSLAVAGDNVVWAHKDGRIGWANSAFATHVWSPFGEPRGMASMGNIVGVIFDGTLTFISDEGIPGHSPG